MEASTLERVGEHLSTERVFVMGDAQVAGFPIRYASQGFVDHFGFCPADIVGKKCGDVIGGSFFLNHMESLAFLATTVGPRMEVMQARIRFLASKAAEACQVMMANPGKRVGVALLVNRKKSGAVFVCECLLLCLRHPTLNFTYCVGFQRDITQEVPLRRLLAAAASDEDYAALIKSRSAALDSRRAVLLGVGSENVVKYLHEKAAEAFPEPTSTMKASAEEALEERDVEVVVTRNGASRDMRGDRMESKTVAERSWDRVQSFGLERFGEMLAHEFFQLAPETEALFAPEVCEKHWDWSASSPPSSGQAPKLHAKRAASLAPEDHDTASERVVAAPRLLHNLHVGKAQLADAALDKAK